jgi:hypothetical protein
MLRPISIFYPFLSFSMCSDVYFSSSFCSCAQFFWLSGPESWRVFKVWWGHKPIMASNDLSGVAGANIYSALHPVSFFVFCIASRTLWKVVLDFYVILLLDSNDELVPCLFSAGYRENCLSVDYQESIPSRKWIFVGQSWNVPFGRMVGRRVVQWQFPPTAHLPLSRWNHRAKPIWHCPKCRVPID